MKTKSFISLAIILGAALIGQAGLVTNDVPFGEPLTFSISSLHNVHPIIQFTSDELLYYRLHDNYFTSADDTNLIPVHYLAFPYSQTFDFHLFDDRGKEVRKTLKGWYNSRETKIPKYCDN